MATEILRPNGGGHTTEQPYYDGSWHLADPAHNWEQVDEVTPDGGATVVSELSQGYGIWYKDTYNLQNHSVGSGAINYVTVYSRTRGTIGEANLKLCLRTHDTDYETDPITLTSLTNYNLWSHEWTTNPATGQPFTWAEIDALEAGTVAYDRTGGNVNCRTTQVYVGVSYTVGVGRSFGLVIG